MPKPRKVWMMSPAKNPKPSVPDSIKTELAAKAIQLIDTVLRPKHVLPPKPDAQFNYITDIRVKWHGNYFYFISTYACPRADALSPTFESRFARMGYVGEGKFDLSFHRHTGEWIRIHEAVSEDESLKAIQDDPWFLP